MKQAKWSTALLPRAVAALSLLSVLLDAAAGCASSSEDERYRVVRKTDSDGKQLVVALGDNAKLFCHTSVPWKKCVWKPPRNGVKEVSVRGIFRSLQLRAGDKLHEFSHPGSDCFASRLRSRYATIKIPPGSHNITCTRCCETTGRLKFLSQIW